jgi:hypothetical protein
MIEEFSDALIRYPNDGPDLSDVNNTDSYCYLCLWGRKSEREGENHLVTESRRAQRSYTLQNKAFDAWKIGQCICLERREFSVK